MELSFGLILNIIIAIYLFVDAKKRDRSPILWGILGLLFGLLPLGIYLIITGRKLWGWILVIISILYFIFAVIAGIFGILFSLFQGQ
ncbi:hypothetical protein [Pseudalkalibacillus caeni]|uniref:Uncharacterized protein n=1 Tax=Exobacillus caeni TaxID=2574798 RepID=A0A5R9F726_9BACL|nr:hypothetical protein [Pseudalkalibacillus caeni]TLS35585.1 hypothetical protein FCL54_19700 [Pseudalkalibacillus caeni]